MWLGWLLDICFSTSLVKSRHFEEDAWEIAKGISYVAITGNTDVLDVEDVTRRAKPISAVLFRNSRAPSGRFRCGKSDWSVAKEKVYDQWMA